MQNERLIYLFHQHFNRKNTPVEKEELLQMAMNPANESALRQLIEESWDAPLPLYSQPDAKADDIFNYILNYTAVVPAPVHRVHFLKTSWFRYAAAVVLLAGAAAVWYELSRSSNLSSPPSARISSASGDIAPGGEKAVLTLADGSTIILDNAANGNVAQQGNTKIIKLDNGQLAYNALPLTKGGRGDLRQGGLSKDLLYNTISTPRGGQYQITLPDGSKVWLNAASSIKFPTAFTGTTREVEMTGEAYLEIAKNSKQPFRVKANGTEIQVLGTSFNINAYQDEEAVKTTLVDGRVKVSLSPFQRATEPGEGREQSSGGTASVNGPNAVILKPGQQAQIALAASSDRQAKGITVVANADLDQTLAWKTGCFKFTNASIQDVMRQLARWYDLEVVYEGKISGDRFDGKIARNSMASQVLSVLEKNQVHFRIEGKKLIVLP